MKAPKKPMARATGGGGGNGDKKPKPRQPAPTGTNMAREAAKQRAQAKPQKMAPTPGKDSLLPGPKKPKASAYGSMPKAKKMMAGGKPMAAKKGGKK